MDLSRAKTVFIIAFLALNLFLGYQNLLEYRIKGAENVVTSEELEQTKAVLEENNFYLQVAVPRLAPKSAFLSVAPVHLEFRRALQLFFPDCDKIQQNVQENGAVTCRQGNKMLTVYPSGRLLYEREASEVREHPPREEALQEAENFLKVKGLKPESAVLDYIEFLERQVVVIHYCQEYNDYPVFSGYAEVAVSGVGVESADIYWLHPLELSERKKLDVIPVTLALRRFSEEFGPSAEPTYITDLSFGFYSREYDAEVWEMPPVWRIQLDGRSDQVFFVNALTGNIEE